jgi:PKD-like domain
MRRIFLSLAVLLSLGMITNGQDALTVECPNLEVIGPRWIMSPKESATFVLQSAQDFPEAYKYEWSVDNGTITNGQGTRIVDVIAHGYGVNVKATVSVSGLQKGCSNTASETVGVEPEPHIGVIDEWGEMPNDDQRGRLDLFFAELSNNPTHKGLIIIYSKNKAVERRRLKLYLDHARFRRFDKSQLTFCLMVVGQTSTKLYRLRSDFLDKPEPECKLISGTLLK